MLLPTREALYGMSCSGDVPCSFNTTQNLVERLLALRPDVSSVGSAIHGLHHLPPRTNYDLLLSAPMIHFIHLFSWVYIPLATQFLSAKGSPLGPLEE
jgi:hypothetical protein